LAVSSIQAQSHDPFIQRIGLVRSYPCKSEIIREDDPANRVYEVICGTICTCKMLREGRRQIAGFYFPGDVFGFEHVGKHSLAAQAVTDAEVRVVRKQELTALASSDPEFANRLLTLTARDLARKQDLAFLLSRGAEERVIFFLIEMVERSSPKEDLISLPMSRQDIADYLGLTIETVSRILWSLERRGAIKISGRRSIALRNKCANGRTERPVDRFKGVKGRRPKTEQELDEWLVSPEGKAATVFNLTPLSRWGESGRS
jgi:CRP/FNR family nitrogen fixation transcriptional regulator